MNTIDLNAAQAGDDAEVSLHASWGRRLVAWLIDAVLVLFAIGIAQRALAAGGTLESWGVGVGTLFVIPAGYYTLCHGSRGGQTLGKRMLGIAVRHQESLGRLGFARAFGRWAITVFFWCCLGIGGVLDGLWALRDSRRRTWHDKIAGSVVIRL